MEDDYILYLIERLDDIIDIAEFLKTSLKRQQTKNRIFNKLTTSDKTSVNLNEYIELKKENELLKKRLGYRDKDFSLNRASYINYIHWNDT